MKKAPHPIRLPRTRQRIVPPAWVLAFAIMIAGLLGHGQAEPLILAHYMPWYGTKDVSGRWGWHWTMNHFDPERVRWDGQRETASHDYPLIGLYDSSDDQALECQVLLMKFAGLDGVVIDWYGTRNALDYAANQQHTEKLIPWLKKAGLRFAICYEDGAIEEAVKAKAIPASESLAQAKSDLQWAQGHWFGDAAYVKQNDRPVLLDFGPQYLQREQWSALRSALPSNPVIFGLPHLAKDHGLDGIFGWPPVEGGKTLTAEQWTTKLNTLYARRSAGESVIATVFPEFKDIYQQAGVHESYGTIAPRLGATFAESLDLALKSGAPMVQVATWNDYGEGTMIEPTRNRGYQYLERLQKRKGGKAYGVADLRLPVMLHQLRKRSLGDTEISAELDKAAALLFASKCREAEAVLAKVGTTLGTRPATFADFPHESDENYHFLTEVLYREGQPITAEMNQRCRLDVYFPTQHPPFPTVVWFHGGGLTSGERSIPLQLRRQGIAVVDVNYRLSPGAKSPAYIEDAAAAVAWTMKNIAKYGGSPDKVFVSGHSAGAYLTLMLGLDKHWLAAEGVDANRIAGLIPLSPQVITHLAIREERGIDDKQPIVDEFAPLFHVRKDAPPILDITGDREKEMLGRYEENAYFWRMMKLVGQKDITLHEMQGYDHGSMPEPAFPLLLRFVREHAEGTAAKQ